MHDAPAGGNKRAQATFHTMPTPFAELTTRTVTRRFTDEELVRACFMTRTGEDHLPRTVSFYPVLGGRRLLRGVGF